jgi:hypothetical protein
MRYSWLCIALSIGVQLFGAGCSDDTVVAEADASRLDAVAEAAVADQGLTDRGTAEASLADAAGPSLDVTCPDGSKPDWSSLGSCQTLISKIVAECCPTAPQDWLQGFAGAMVCAEDADQMCQGLLADAVGYQATCEGVASDPVCQ